MGTCIICGASTDGRICSSHEEDVAFEFRGNSADKLVTGRYYRGTVDGFADFGVFVNVGDSGSVTGLLHRSELDRRLDSLDWDRGDPVYVQVTDVHDNGDIDLGWSIRQSDREFRGVLIHDPDADVTTYEPDSDPDSDSDSDADAGSGSDAESDSGGESHSDANADADPGGGVSVESGPAPGHEPEAAPGGEAAAEPTSADDSRPESASESGDVAGSDTAENAESIGEPAGTGASASADAGASESQSQSVDGEPERVSVGSLGDRLGERVRLEGTVSGVRQTGGPTVFEVGDETGTVECAAFVGAGERAYPEIEAEEVVALIGEVERHRGELQVETESLVVLEGAAREAVEERLESARESAAAPPDADPLAEDAAVEAVAEDVTAVATLVREAVTESRPVIVRHTATVDGYVAGAAVERAILPLVRENHEAADAEYHKVDRRPLRDSFYDVDAATDDVATMLEDEARHGEKHPLFVLVDVGSTRESIHGLGFLDTYDAPSAVVDAGPGDEEALETAGATLVSDAEGLTTATLAAHAAVAINPDVRGDVEPLPAFSYWGEVPETYTRLASEHGYDAEGAATVREAIALEAYYQSYQGKRELVQDIFWGEGNGALAGHVADQFESKVGTAVETARPHLETRTAAGQTVTVFDAEAFTHRKEFPPLGLLLDALRREGATEGILLGVAEDELHVRGDGVDLRSFGDAVADRVEDAGVRARGAAADAGHVEFLVGAREAVIEAAVEAAGERDTEQAPARE
jgi:RecJ-like exonuclease